MKASEPKWVNQVLNIIGINSLRLGGFLISRKIKLDNATSDKATKYPSVTNSWNSNFYSSCKHFEIQLSSPTNTISLTKEHELNLSSKNEEHLIL